MTPDYDGRRFRKTDDPEDGPIATYRQDGDLVWAEFGGGRVRRGTVTGLCRADGSLVLGYTMVLDSGEVVSGRTVNTPEVAEDGRLRLREDWERFGEHAEAGTDYLEEVR